jgi:hypothetical protein
MGLVYEYDGWFEDGYKTLGPTFAYSTSYMGHSGNIGGIVRYDEIGKINKVYLAFSEKQNITTESVIKIARELSKATKAPVHWRNGKEKGCEYVSE